MNYLAHIYLSGTDEKTLVGNFIGDFIKGNKYASYPVDIQNGILLHRKIDSFTDAQISEMPKSLSEIFTDYIPELSSIFFTIIFLPSTGIIFLMKVSAIFQKKHMQCCYLIFSIFPGKSRDFYHF